jgi:ADP-ribosylglycohydrolase
MNRLDCVRGCLLGIALGDALGAPVEFLRVDEIDRRFGRDGPRDLMPWRGHPAGAYTDDTQMTLATARGLLSAARAAQSDPTPLVISEYVRWYKSQLDDPSCRRAPGETCLEACAALARDPTPRPAANDSCGCGAVMRMGPVGLLGRRHVFGLGAWLGALTHGHPAGFLSAGYLAEAIAAIVAGADLAEALAAADTAMAAVGAAADGWPQGDGWPCLEAGVGTPTPDAERSVATCAAELRRWRPPRTPLDEGRRQLAAALSAARAGAATSASDRDAIAALGGGWTGQEALAIAALCALRYRDDWTAAVVAAANHSGDSDSTASVVGGIVGALRGAAHLPASWLHRLENRESIEALAEGLAL